jgi:DNA modification methylase
MEQIRLFNDNCLIAIKELPDNSVDSIVTDPPYHLTSITKRFGKEDSAPAKFGTDGAFQRASKGFMGKEWDGGDISFRNEIWEECLRVLKPGGHLLSFGGSRTYHRMAVAIEDSGFEIRDQIMWIYGSGFPKSYNIGKAVDKIQGNDREVVGEKVRGDVEKAKENGAGYLADPANRNNKKSFGYGTETITKGKSEFEGFGTALKPAHEPIVMARKPFKGSVAGNVLQFGTGGINIDESRILYNGLKPLGDEPELNTDGRFPANVIFDEEAGKILDAQSLGASRFFYCGKASKNDRNEGLESKSTHPTVKPTKLMEYLIKLITPKGGVVLDPFMGSGSTGKAAIKNDFNFIGIEREKEYFDIAKARIEYAKGSGLFKPE